jgi:hypothetical protein
MLPILVEIHSLLRYVVLALLLVSLVFALVQCKQSVQGKALKLYLFSMIAFHIQFLLGLVLYFLSPKVVFMAETMKSPVFRFFTAEHGVGMLIAFVLITLGYKRVKATKSNKSVLLFYGLALLVICASIPWAFRGLGVS